MTRAFRRTKGHQGTRAPIRHDYRPEHIPAFLEQDWYQRHLAACTGSASKIVRRAAAVRLVQWAMGGSQDNAATFLGITPDQAQFTAISDTRRWMRAGCDPLEFDRALRTLASELRALQQSPIDYRRRRQALQKWTISPDTWNAIVSDLPQSPYSSYTDLGDRKRQAASVYVWTLVTRGEHTFAPLPLEAAQPDEVRRQWISSRSTTWFQLTRPDPIGHYAHLRGSLAEYAQQLARDIDAGIGQGHLNAHAQ
ncbi:hypothetical protein [Streptomyces sp. NBC_00893]|uniref:hypothetical protein n=1 Tax=Streptomyces sp. NBC_00893 TaxID=2975862 RepID=UPI00224F254E|nr:hypothetical protein [Streptomyces sp. NBC_00893]MCX4850395.1 hypothetical protein [Streptomyces sp. NBC_00893]